MFDLYMIIGRGLCITLERLLPLSVCIRCLSILLVFKVSVYLEIICRHLMNMLIGNQNQVNNNCISF